MKTLFLTFVIGLFVSLPCTFAQEQNTELPLRNTIYTEILGNGLWGSVNYERQLTNGPGLSFRVGVGMYTERDFYLTLPVSLQYLIRLKESQFIETGVGYTWAGTDAHKVLKERRESDNIRDLFLSVGYRRHFAEDWMWKLSFTPIITNNYDVTMPWLGFALGKRF